MRKGKLFVVEGLDGAGKNIQAGRLIVRLGQRVPPLSLRAADFPRHGHEAAYAIQKFLRRGGFRGYGSQVHNSPYAASIAFAYDRMDEAHSLDGDQPNLVDFLSLGGVAVSNRYTQSNIGFQGSRFGTLEQLKEFIDWLYRMEYEWLKIPRPTLAIFLDLPPALAKEAKLAQLASINKKPDAYESDINTYIRAQAAYRQAAAMFPEEWRTVDCMAPDGSRRKTVDEVAEDVFQTVQPLIGLEGDFDVD